MDSQSIVQSNPTAWAAIHVGLVTATHEVANGSTDLVNIAQGALKSIRDAGYTPQPNDKATRFTGLGITRWQTMLYAVNELPDWHFPDDVLCVGWLIECGGPSMDRGPARAQFEDRVKHYVGGTRNRYNRGTSGHGGDGFPESREYSLEECPHVGSRPAPSHHGGPSESSALESMSTTSQAPVADEPKTRPESPTTTDPSDLALKHLPKTTRTDKVSLNLDVKHSKENLQTVIEEYMSLCHRCPTRANGRPKSAVFFVYALTPEEGNVYVQAAYGWNSTPLLPGTISESPTTTETSDLALKYLPKTTRTERKGGKWGFEITGGHGNAGSGLSEREEMELNSLGWRNQTDPSSGEFYANLYQEFSESQVLRGDAAANMMDAFRRYKSFSNRSMASVQIEGGVELIRLTEKDFEGGRIRRPEPSDDNLSDKLRLTFGLVGSVIFWYVVVSSGLFSALPWWLILFLGMFNLYIFSLASGALGEDASRTPESNQRRRQAIPEKVRHSVWRRDEGRCVKCGSQEKLEFDHIIPWSKGGSDTERNLQLLCERCNRTKSASI